LVSRIRGKTKTKARYEVLIATSKMYKLAYCKAKKDSQNQLTGVSSCGVERGEATFELNLIPELRSKSQIFTGLS
jgi:hypothetical protein